MHSRVSLVEVNTLQSVLSRLYMIIINYGKEQGEELGAPLESANNSLSKLRN